VTQESPLTLAVIAKAHLGLAKANGVFSGTDAIKLLEFALFDILRACKRICHGLAMSATEGQQQVWTLLHVEG
jgi:hypothetical protein